MSRPGDMITFAGVSDGSTLSGAIALNSDILYSTVSGLALPKGIAMKIWGIRITGEAATIVIMFTKTSGAVAVQHDAFYHAWTSGLSVPPTIIEKERPIVILGLAGTEFVQLGWQQISTGVTNVEIDVEFVNGQI